MDRQSCLLEVRGHVSAPSSERGVLFLVGPQEPGQGTKRWLADRLRVCNGGTTEFCKTSVHPDRRDGFGSLPGRCGIGAEKAWQIMRVGPLARARRRYTRVGP